MIRPFRSVARSTAILIAICFSAGVAFAAGGACPAGLPVGTPANGCYFIAANGSDTNTGTDESHPWLHAPGMPNCTSNCAAANAGNGGLGLIFRGGDTWHFGNSSASPYTGGTFNLYNWFSSAYAGNFLSACIYEGTQTGCMYVGVDQNWYSGASWSRPIFTGDNPTTGLSTTAFASSCAYNIPGNNNTLVNMPAFTYFDSFELTGLCSSNLTPSSGSSDSYFSGWASSGTYSSQSFVVNSYIHGWSATSTAGTGNNSHPVTVLGGGGGVSAVFDHVVVDGSDSNPEVVSWAGYPWFYHMRDSIIRYAGQGVGAQCHDIHDNIFEHFYYTLYDGHTNILECNHDAQVSTANVIYNNIWRHNDPSIGNAEGLWVCPNTTPEYWFNNLMYDMYPNGQGQPWAIAGSLQYPDCTNTGGQYMFNNTLVDLGAAQPCHLGGSNPTGGQYLTVYNEHLINTGWDSGAGGCTGYNDASNVSQSDSTATTQGYTTGSSGTVQPNTCANDSTKPCSPTSGTNSTVGTGKNLKSYCDTLATYTSEYAIGTEAAAACMKSTTNACAFNTSTHTMECPAQTAVARPTTAAWDSGAYQYGLGQTSAPAPPPPSNLTATVQ